MSNCKLSNNIAFIKTAEMIINENVKRGKFFRGATLPPLDLPLYLQNKGNDSIITSKAIKNN